VDADTGEEVATSVHEYADDVIEETLPGEKNRLPPQTALQNPADYLAALEKTIPKVLRAAKAKPEQVVGIGTDFTSCTVLPTRADGSPLCFEKQWRKNPHAWVKLWKHHAAQPEADAINEAGRRTNEYFLKACGGRYSSEWFFSKLLETVKHAPEVYGATERFLEAGDWIVWQLCGQERRCLSAAGFKAMCVYPRLSDSLAPSEGERAGVRGFSFRQAHAKSKKAKSNSTPVAPPPNFPLRISATGRFKSAATTTSSRRTRR